MDLKTFTSNAIVQILEGLADVQKQHSPGVEKPEDGFDQRGIFYKVSYGISTNVHFDIAVTAENAASGNGGISVMSAFKADAEASRKTIEVSRISFDVNIRLPQGLP